MTFGSRGSFPLHFCYCWRRITLNFGFSGVTLLLPFGAFGLILVSREEFARVLDFASYGAALLLPFSKGDFVMSFGTDLF